MNQQSLPQSPSSSWTGQPAPQAAPAQHAGTNPELEAQKAAGRKVMFIAVGLSAGVFLSLVITLMLVVVFAFKTASSKRKEASRRAHIEHAAFTFRTPRHWTTRDATSAPVLFIIEPDDASAASIHVEAIPVWRGGQEIAPENVSQYLPGTGVRHQRDEMDGVEAVVGFSQDKAKGIWYCVAGARRAGKDYIIRAEGPDREALIDAIFLVRKTWRWKS